MSYHHHHVKDVRDLDAYQKFQLSRVLGGRSALGFYQYYFNDLKHHPTQIECFNHVNDLYFDIYGEYRYESYQSFSNQYKKHFLRQK